MPLRKRAAAARQGPTEGVPETFRDEAVVLRRRPFAEADWVLTCITREHGKLGVLARGARRARARNAAGLDLLTRSELMLAPGRGLAVLTQARPLGIPWPGADVIRTACGGVLAELVDAVLEEGHPDPRLYQLTSEVRECMADPRGDPRLELVLAAFTIASLGGYRPELERCVGCDKPLTDSEGEFVARLGGVLQGACREGRPEALPCSAAALRVLRRLEQGDEATLRRLRWSNPLRDQVEAVLIAHLEHHLDRSINSAKVLAQVRP